MKRIYLILLVLIGISTSCTKNFEDFNTDKKRPSVVPAGFLFANAQKAFADQESNTNVNLNEFNQWSQYLTATTYTDETNYDIINRTVAGTVFRIYYRDILRDLKESKDLITLELPITDKEKAVQKNKLLIVDMMEVLVYNNLVNIFGNVPYTEALDIKNLYPKYDDGLTIYKDLLTRLTTDITGLDIANGSFGADDLYMGGDVAMWKKFGNTLKVRVGITLADVDDASAKAAIEAAYAGGFAAGENCQLVYLGAANSNNFYLDLVNSGRDDFIAANTVINMLSNLNDPRISKYFTAKTHTNKRNLAGKIVNDTLQGTGKVILIYSGGPIQANLPFVVLAADSLISFKYFIGGPYGESNPFGQYSHVAPAILDPTFPAVILDNIELEFYLAEAAARGYAVGGTAEEHYNKAITNSILSWGGSAVDAATYLANPQVAYATATGTWQQKIGTQAWLAFFLRGEVGFTSWRRLDFPILTVPSSLGGIYNDIPKRYTYPVNEQTLNPASYTAAASAIGGDKLTTPIFWDKFQPVPGK